MAVPAANKSAISFENWITAPGTQLVSYQIIGGVSFAAENPPENLLQEDRAVRFQTEAGAGSVELVVDLGSAKLPTVVGCIDLNNVLSGGILLRGADDAAISTGVIAWLNLNLTTHSYNRVVRWYLGAPDSGTLADKRYWQITLDAPNPPVNGPDAFHVLGVWWLGEHSEFEIQEGCRIRPVLPPRRRSPGGSLRTYRRATVHPMYREIDFGIQNQGSTFADVYDLREKLEQASHVLLDIHASAELEDTGLAKFSAYYGLLSEDGVDAELQHAELSDLTLRFEESQAEAP